MGRLDGKRIAILATDGVEQVELLEPRQVLINEGAQAEVVSIKKADIRGWDHTEWGESIPVDRTLDTVKTEDYDALLLPGGVRNSDALRTDGDAVFFVKRFFDLGMPVAAICHAPWLLIEADAVRGRKLTSWPSLASDLRNAGADWMDEEVIVDNGLITSRNPGDIPAFCEKMIEEFEEGVHKNPR